MVSKPVVCLNDEPAEDDEAGEIEVIEDRRVFPTELAMGGDKGMIWGESRVSRGVYG